MTTDWTPEPADIAAMREAAAAAASAACSVSRSPKAKPASSPHPPSRGLPAEAPRRQRRHLPALHRRPRRALPPPHPGPDAAAAPPAAACPVGADRRLLPDLPGRPQTRCHLDGMPLPAGTVHARRYQEAEEVAA